MLTALWNVPCGMSCVVAALVDVEVMWRALWNGGVLVDVVWAQCPKQRLVFGHGALQDPKPTQGPTPQHIVSLLWDTIWLGPPRLNKATTFQTRPNPEQTPDEHPLRQGTTNKKLQPPKPIAATSANNSFNFHLNKQ